MQTPMASMKGNRIYKSLIEEEIRVDVLVGNSEPRCTPGRWGWLILCKSLSDFLHQPPFPAVRPEALGPGQHNCRLAAHRGRLRQHSN